MRPLFSNNRDFLLVICEKQLVHYSFSNDPQSVFISSQTIPVAAPSFTSFPRDSTLRPLLFQISLPVEWFFSLEWGGGLGLTSTGIVYHLILPPLVSVQEFCSGQSNLVIEGSYFYFCDREEDVRMVMGRARRSIGHDWGWREMVIARLVFWAEGGSHWTALSRDRIWSNLCSVGFLRLFVPNGNG